MRAITQLPNDDLRRAQAAARMAEAAGFDGGRPRPFCTRRYLEEVRVLRLGEGLAHAGRARPALEIVGGGFIATGPDAAAVAKMLDYVRFYGHALAHQ